jgi:dipicolinate synthase subunit A
LSSLSFDIFGATVIPSIPSALARTFPSPKEYYGTDPYLRVSMEGMLMKKQIHFSVIGGDLRQGKLAELLAKDGHIVHTFGLERLPEPLSLPQASTLEQASAIADCIILPLPMCGENGLNLPFGETQCSLGQLITVLRPEQIICAGMVETALSQSAASRGLVIHDYFAREELAIANAIPTVEGAIGLAMEEMPITLHGANALVTGYGRLGKLLSSHLSALGAHVSVSARRYDDFAWINAYGFRPLHTAHLEDDLPSFDVIINTVPARVLDRRQLSLLSPGCLCIDLASRPGGIAFEAAAELGVKAIWALSLPGKVAPVTAGQAIRDTIYNILQELGVSL